jgi:hypothetical protein
MVSRAQSAFIKKRSIHDNFLYTQNLIRAVHRVRKPTLFLKLDIAKAFDTVKMGLFAGGPITVWVWEPLESLDHNFTGQIFINSAAEWHKREVVYPQDWFASGGSFVPNAVHLIWNLYSVC